MTLLVRFGSVVFGLALLLGSTASVRGAEPLTVKLEAENNSGETGTATLTAVGDKETKVVLSVTGAPAGVQQPVHIHKGTCAKLDPKPTYPLSPLTNGKSETTVKAALKDLGKDFAINGHKSAKEATVYVFCGNIAGM